MNVLDVEQALPVLPARELGDGRSQPVRGIVALPTEAPQDRDRAACDGHERLVVVAADADALL
jgi:hypothetical protein